MSPSLSTSKKRKIKRNFINSLGHNEAKDTPSNQRDNLNETLENKLNQLGGSKNKISPNNTKDK